MIAAVQWLSVWVFSMEVPGSNASKFLNIFHASFYPVLLEYLNLRFTFVWILFHNSVTVTVISFKPQKV